MVIVAATLPFDEALDELRAEGSRTRLKPPRTDPWEKRVTGNGYWMLGNR